MNKSYKTKRSIMDFLNQRTVIGLLRLMKDWVLTRIFYRNARIIRFPFDLRAPKYVSLGTNITLGVGCRFEAHPERNRTLEKCLVIGRDVEMNDYVHIVAGNNVSIGNNVLIASKVFISDLNHGGYSSDYHSSPLEKPNERELIRNEVIIESNVWIGESVSILPGVKIGKGSIIGANSVVTKNIPQDVIAAGIPAKPIKKYCWNENIWKKL